MRHHSMNCGVCSIGLVSSVLRHDCSFLVEQMEGAAVSADQSGWKDVVAADDDDWSTFIVRFDYPADEQHPYMYHCHILEHEDMGMMGQFTVS